MFKKEKKTALKLCSELPSTVEGIMNNVRRQNFGNQPAIYYYIRDHLMLNLKVGNKNVHLCGSGPGIFLVFAETNYDL